jgi:putative membrane protein
MLWIKVIHIFFVVSWMAGLLYLPRLFVYHASCEDEPGHQRFLVMERRLYYGIMYPAAILSMATGLWMLIGYRVVYNTGIWPYLKLALVALLFVYHLVCGHWYRAFKAGKNRHSHKYFRWLNEIPGIILLLITILVVVRPF